MERYRAVATSLLRQVLAEAGPSSLPLHIQQPSLCRIEDAYLAHDAAYVNGYLSGALPSEAARRVGFDWSPAFAERTLAITGGTLEALQLPMEHTLPIPL